MQHSRDAERLNFVFQPRSVALIGASRDPDSISGVLLKNLRQSFAGPIYPVNPHAERIDGLPVPASIATTPAPVDLAFIAVPASCVLETIEQCAAAGVKAIVLITAGFSESGEEGRRRQAQLLACVNRCGIILIGPNCMGVINTDRQFLLNGTFSPAVPDPGNVAVCTQSGALGVVVLDSMRQRHMGISTFVSIGNKAAVGENDLLAYWARDSATDVIQLYLESFQNAAEFRRMATAITPHKPILALKSGRNTAGREAAGSHTAAVASPDAAVDALFRQSGVIRADTLEELLAVTDVLSCQPVPRGRRAAVLTDAGGPGILCVDALEARQLAVPELSDDLKARLRSFLRPETTVRNPIDLIATTDADEYRKCLRILLESDEIDSVIVICVARLAETSNLVAQAIRETCETSAPDKPVLGVFMRADAPPGELMTSSYRLPSFRYPENAANALARVVRFAEWRREPVGTVRSIDDIDIAAARTVVKAALRQNEGDGWLHPPVAEKLLQICGLATPRWEAADTAQAAVHAFRRFDGPVVLKVVAHNVLHKSDVGGVAANLQTAAAVAEAFEAIMAGVEGASGVVVQEFVKAGHDIMIGMVRDAQFGPQIAFGAGGTLVEFLDDLAIRLAPLTSRDIDAMIRETRIGDLIQHGFRDRAPGDIETIRDVLARLSFIAENIPEIVELDFNPLKVLPPSEGCRIVDAKIRVTSCM